MVRRPMARLAMVAALLAQPLIAFAQLKDPKIASRALTDADMEKYVAITIEVKKAQKQAGKEISTPAGMQKVREATIKAAEPHGWGSLDYSVVDARVTVARQHIKMEKTVPVPADKKAEVDLVRKWQAKIEAARKSA